MKVILCESVEGVGNKGDVVEVEDDLAIYHLFPKGIAVEATLANLNRLDRLPEDFSPDKLEHPEGFDPQKRSKWLKSKAVQTSRVLRLCNFASRLNGTEITLDCKERDNGAVTPEEITDALSEQTGFEIAPSRIEITGDELNTPGKHAIPVRLNEEITAHIRAIVKGDEEELKEEEPAQTKEEYTEKAHANLDILKTDADKLETFLGTEEKKTQAKHRARIDTLRQQLQSVQSKLEDYKKINGEESKTLKGKLEESFINLRKSINQLWSRLNKK